MLDEVGDDGCRRPGIATVGRHGPVGKVAQPGIECGQHDHHRQRLEVTYALSIEIGPDRQARTQEQLAQRIEDSIVDVQKTVLKIMPHDVKIQSSRRRGLSAVRAVPSLGGGLAVLAVIRHTTGRCGLTLATWWP